MTEAVFQGADLAEPLAVPRLAELDAAELEVLLELSSGNTTAHHGDPSTASTRPTTGSTPATQTIHPITLR